MFYTFDFCLGTCQANSFGYFRQVAAVLENNEHWGCCQDGRQVSSFKHPCHAFIENEFIHRLADFRRKITGLSLHKESLSSIS